MPSSQFASDLVVVSRFLAEGAEAASRGDDISVRSALLLVDLAAESLLKLTLRRYGKRAKGSPNASFHVVLDAAIAAPDSGGPALEYLAQPLTALRNARNCVMHDGTGQDPQVARQLCSRASAALSRLGRDVFGVDVLDLHLDKFLRDGFIRYLLDVARKHLDDEEYWQSAAVSRAAFRFLMGAWAERVQQLLGMSFRARESEPLDPVAIAVSAGVYLPGLARLNGTFQGAVAYVAPTGSIQCVYHNPSSGIPEQQLQKDARDALDFVAGLALQLQGALGLDESEPLGGPRPAQQGPTQG